MIMTMMMISYRFGFRRDVVSEPLWPWYFRRADLSDD
jgi:hypothetical protein